MRKNIFLLLTVVLLFAGCTMQNAYHETLERAKRLMNERPDSALELLDSIFPYQSTFSKSMRMDYMLQRLNAQNKCDTIFRSDSTVRILVDYYSHHGTSNQRMLANYLAGRVYYDMGELPHALHYYQCAVEVADTIRSDCDLYTLYAVYGQMAELFHAQLLPDNEKEALQAAERCAWKDHDTLSALTAYELRFRPYYLKNEKDSVLLILNRVHDLFIKYGHRKRAAQALPSIISISLDRGKYEKAHELMLIYEKESGLFDKKGEIKDGFEIYYYEKGRYATFKHKIDSAVYYFTKLLDAGQYEAGYKGLLQVYQMRGNPDSIAKYATLYAAANDSSFLHVNQHAVHQINSMYKYNRLQRLYDQETANVEKAKRDKMILVFSLLSIVVGTAYVYNKIRLSNTAKVAQLLHDKSEVERLLMKAKEETAKASQQSNDILEKKEQEAALLKKQLDDINRLLAKQSIIKAEEEFYGDKIFAFFEQHKTYGINQQKITEKHWRRLQYAFSDKFPRYYSFIMQNRLTTDQLRVCILLRLDFNEGEMAILMNVDNKRISRVKAQVNKKIFNIDNASSLKSNLSIYF
jgi:hypothetical protein